LVIGRNKRRWFTYQTSGTDKRNCSAWSIPPLGEASQKAGGSNEGLTGQRSASMSATTKRRLPEPKALSP